MSFRNGDFAGNAALYDVNPRTGETTNARQSGADVLLGLAREPTGRLLSMTDSFGRVNGVSVPGGLVALDPRSGATTVVGLLGLESVNEGDLAFNPADGKLYAVTSGGGASTLVTVDPVGGAATPIGALPAADASAMAFTNEGRLFVLDTTFQRPTGAATLYEVDPATGRALASFDTGVALGNVAGMAFEPSRGSLYVADGDNNGTNRLYVLDPATGALTDVGPTTVPGFFGGLAGLVFLPAP
ncbi:MAG TPA: hypothetical protein VFS43_01140 [Polyangiaceae bacterium]|nr:hypothetical protein [Polyangiaceae bacterium]